jgi:hypothetical protein
MSAVQRLFPLFEHELDGEMTDCVFAHAAAAARCRRRLDAIVLALCFLVKCAIEASSSLVTTGLEPNMEAAGV